MDTSRRLARYSVAGWCWWGGAHSTPKNEIKGAVGKKSSGFTDRFECAFVSSGLDASIAYCN